MPLTPTAAKGVIALAIESVAGEQVLLASTPASATITGIAAPTGGSQGSRLHLIITNFTSGGTFTITGVGTPNNTETVTVAALTAQQTQSPVLANFEYTSINAYTAITNITTTGGLTAANTLFVVKAIQAAKFNVPMTKFISQRKVPLYSPNEHTGFMSRDKKLIQQHNETSIDCESDLYGDLSMYWQYLVAGTPAFTSIPAVPPTLLAAAPIAASQTLTTPPTAPGMKLIFTVTTYSGTPSTLTINGTSYGLIVTPAETITINSNGTYYSANVYSAVTTITAGAVSTTTIAITGVYGWRVVSNSEGTRATAAIESFDGSASWTHPFSYANDGDMTVKTQGDAKLTLKGMAQDKLAIGDRTTNPLQVSRVASLGIPLGDLPLAGWQTQVYLDSITGSAQTTVFLDADEEIKITIKTPTESHYLFNNTQQFGRTYPIKPECTVDMTYDIINLLQNEQFRQNLKQYLVVATVGRYIGTTGGVAYYEGWTWTLPLRYDSDYGQEADPSKGNVFAKPTLRTEYDAVLACSFQLSSITQTPPTFAS